MLMPVAASLEPKIVPEESVAPDVPADIPDVPEDADELPVVPPALDPEVAICGAAPPFTAQL
ncbi:MAG TPA: hypothetical protein VGY54_13060 [Polyangiaceae bacterium]|nr:hypothetical protein [Polyangiaceae bacterium]